MKTPKRSRKLKKDKDIQLDARVWGQLQDHIPLQNVYEKLPHRELFRLRVVCKAWNHSALQRLEPKPYFVILAAGLYYCGDPEYLTGVLSYDIASKEYNFKRQRFLTPQTHFVDVPFEVEGLIFCHHPRNLGQQGVFNIHNQTWHSIPPAPKKSECPLAIGMMVDTSERPYSFKLVVGSLDTETQIYDSESRSWTRTSSWLPQVAKPALIDCLYAVTCMCNSGCVYISIGAEILMMYSMEGDEWTVLAFPEVKQVEECVVHALGVWDGRIFTTREDFENRNVSVWELVDQTKGKWIKNAVISGADYDMLMEADVGRNGHSVYEGLRLVPCFCDGYLLIYNWNFNVCQSYALGMLNLATYEWEKVDLPPRTVAFEQVIEQWSETEEGSEGSDSEGGSDKGCEAFDNWEDYNIHESFKEEYSKGNEDSKSEDLDHGCAVKAICIRRETACSKNQEAVIGAPLVTSGCISSEAERPPLTIGCIVMQPPLVGKPATTFSTMGNIGAKPPFAPKAATTSSTMGSIDVQPPVAAKTANLFSTIQKTVMEPNVDKFAWAMCFYESDVPGNCESHKKTKVHRVVEELWIKDKKLKSPLSMLNEYVRSNRLQVNYEITNKMINFNHSCEIIAIVEGDSGGASTKGFGMHSTRQRAKQMAAADVLERTMENVSESEFTNLARNGFVVGGRKRKGGGGGNSWGSGGNGVGGGRGRNPVGSGDSGRGVGGVSGGGGNSAGNVGSSIDSGGCCTGGGGGGGSYPGNPKPVPVTGYNNDSPRAGSLHSNADKHARYGGTGYSMSGRGGRGGMPSRPEIYTERKLEKRTGSYLDFYQGERGYGSGGYGGGESFGGAVGFNSSYDEDVGGIGYVGRKPPALGCGGRGLHPGISAYGHQSHVSLVPHNIGQAQHMPIQNLSILPGSRHQIPVQYISTQHVQAHHALTQHVLTEQAAMRNPLVDGPGQGGIQYSIYDTAPQSSGVSTGTWQTAVPTITCGVYGAYAVNQEYVSTAVPLQETAPGTSNATQPTLVAQYGVAQPQQLAPQQHVGYTLQRATQHQQS